MKIKSLNILLIGCVLLVISIIVYNIIGPSSYEKAEMAFKENDFSVALDYLNKIRSSSKDYTKADSLASIICFENVKTSFNNKKWDEATLWLSKVNRRYYSLLKVDSIVQVTDTLKLLSEFCGYYRKNKQYGRVMLEEGFPVENAKMNLLVIIAPSGRFQHRGLIYSENRYGTLDIGSGNMSGRWRITNLANRKFSFVVEKSKWTNSLRNTEDPLNETVGSSIYVLILNDGNIFWNGEVYEKQGMTELLNLKNIEQQVEY
ncbi:MAG: hypothetical protein Q8L88_09770 [Bacteroidota bacterium]|nr:hypothetical protein [Bacteroidota bacterium]